MLIHEQLVGVIEELPAHDSRIRRHDPRGVHQMRVASRRLRSLLATFGPWFDAEVVTHLRAELRWLAGELAAARDSGVLRARLTTLVTSPEEGAVVDRIGDDLEVDEEAGMERAIAALDSERYSAVLRDLNRLATDPPWANDGEEASDEELRGRVRRDWKRLRRRAARAGEAEGEEAHPELLHQVRKAAKRLRYASEALVPAYGEDAERLARAAKRVQTELGEVQDSVVSQEVLRARAAATENTREEVFLLGGLEERERLLAADAELRYVRRWDKLARKKNRRWLS